MDRRRDRIRRDMRRKIDRSLRPSETSFEREMDEIVGEDRGNLACEEYRLRMLELADYAEENWSSGHVPRRMRQSWGRFHRPLMFFAARNECITDRERRRIAKLAREVQATLGRRELGNVVRRYKQTVKDVL